MVAAITALLSLAAGSVGAAIESIFSLFGMFLLQAALVKAVQALGVKLASARACR